MLDTLSYNSIGIVLSSWELARQKYSDEEHLGLQFLSQLFESNPETKRYFGFRPEQDVIHNPMLRMGMLIHARILVDGLNDIISLLGPDLDDVYTLLFRYGVVFAKVDVTKDIVPEALCAIRSVLANCLGSQWDQRVDDAWTEVISKLSSTIFL